ncbi:MAG TPA: sigma-70 family RNA polymerase sigma factor [Planctomycetota bacterium]
MVVRAAAGDGDAFEILVSRYQDRVFNTLTRLCGSGEEAEDLAQETFMKAYRSLNSFRQGSRFYTWLFRIAVNTALSQRRQHVRRRAHEGLRLDASGVDEDGERGLNEVVADPRSKDPAGEMEQEQIRERVREGLAQIDGDYRTILLLREVEGMDYDAISDTLDLSRAAVKSRLHRARLEMARILKDLRPLGAAQ